MDAVFPSHNVSESLPKETTASPITLSNRISQEMYRLHRLVPLAKRINEKSYNTTLPFPHRANQTYLITNCYKPGTSCCHCMDGIQSGNLNAVHLHR